MLSYYDFNSIKVRLKLSCERKQPFVESDFNSIKVRLKLPFRRTDERFAVFQFHKGTIKTKKAVAVSKRILFQFHKGTIKTTELLALSCKLSNFNSIKVRLKPLMNVLKFSDMNSFQFHKGTIKTILAPNYIVCIYLISIP